jgi:hypothetical protein
MIVYLPVLVALIGVLMYGFCANPKLSEIGRLAFFVGLFVFLLHGQAALSVVK